MISELGSHNFRKLGQLGKLLVVGVIDPKQTDGTVTFLDGMKEVVRAGHNSQIGSRYTFSYIDGVRWAGFVRQFGIDGDLPKMFVLDMPISQFYEDPEVDEPDEIETFLLDILEGKVSNAGTSVFRTNLLTEEHVFCYEQ